ncbi:major facilitator superfamily domain-containing protein, partial [Mycotypha africana]|uniref:major facilitator superfamily domain-containing protein n=1 Tax=Mycotypha africana TaxID=64632 RepID=UPI002300DCE5
MIEDKKNANPSTVSSYEEKGQHDHIEVLDVPFIKSPEEKRYIRKLNIRLLPLAGILIFLQFVDKSALSVAAVLGLLHDAQLTLNQYSWLSAMFYLGYFVFQLPNNYLMQHLPIGKYLGSLLVCWGAVTIGTAFCKNFAQLAVLRVFLGVFEAGTYPCLIMIFSRMYRRSEQSACFGFLYLCNGLASIVGSASAVGIVKIGVKNGIKPWQWGYIIWGSITVFIGIVSLFLLIDGPNAWFLQLTEDEKPIVEDRIRDNAVVRKHKVKISQYWEALKEPRLWLMFFTSCTHNLQNGGLVSYSTVLVKGLGFNAIQSILLQIPSGAFTVIFISIAVVIHRKTKQMIYTAVICYTISAIGCLLLSVFPNSGIKLLGYYLTWAQTGSYVMLVAIVGSTVSGYSKKIFYNGVLMLAFTIGNFAGPLMLVEHTGPAYKPAMWGYFAANLLNSVLLMMIRIILDRTNKKRLKHGVGERTDVYLNLTDKEDKNYIYSL